MTTQTPETVLILGATSEIGGEIAVRLAKGRNFILAAKRTDALEGLTTRLANAGARDVTAMHFDAKDPHTIHDVIAAAPALSHAVVCFGILGDQQKAEVDPSHAFDIATVDYSSQVAALTQLAHHMENQGSSGTLIAFSSIAGWRARRANYVYGSTKAGLDAFCQGLMDRLHGSKVKLVLARPGFVIGSMTKGMKPAPMSVTADVVADHVVKACAGNKSATVWIPRKLQALAWAMRVTPRPIWRKMPR